MSDDTHDRLAALGRDQERTGRRVEELREQLGHLAADVTRLADGIAAAADGQPPAVRSWLLADDPERALRDLTALCAWVTDVYLRYPETALPTCWLWHPAVVEELMWLRGAHVAAYTGQEASWRAAADWHDRHRPGVTSRLQKIAHTCALERHQASHPRRHQPPGPAPLAYAVDEITTAWLLDRAQPEPTPRHIADADQHQADRHQRNRS